MLRFPASLETLGRPMPGGRRTLAGAASAAVMLLLAVGSGQAAADTATIGLISLTPEPAHTSYQLSASGEPAFQGDAAAGYVVSAPQNGSITSWSFLSAGLPTGTQFELVVLEPTAATQSWREVAVSAPATITSATGTDAINGPFASDIAIDAGDRVGLEEVGGTVIPLEPGVAGQDGIRFFSAPLASGGTGTVAAISTIDDGYLLPVQATEVYTLAPAQTSAPTISGTPTAGSTLTCNPGIWTGSPSYSYSWSETSSILVPGHPPAVHSTTTVVATGQTFVVPDLVGGSVTFTCTVTASNAAGSGQATSLGVGMEASRPLQPPRVGLTPNHPTIYSRVGAGGHDLCLPGLWLHHPTVIHYQWWRVVYNPLRRVWERRGNSLSHSQSVYLPVLDEGIAVQCFVNAVNSAGNALAASNVVVVPQGAPIPTGAPKVIVTEPSPILTDPVTSPSAPLQPGTNGQLGLACMTPKFNRSVSLSYQWQVDFHGYVPGQPAGPFLPEATAGGVNLTVQDSVPLGDGTTGATPARPPAIDPILLDGETGPSASGGDGYITLRCVVTATITKPPHNATVVWSPVVYVLAVGT